MRIFHLAIYHYFLNWMTYLNRYQTFLFLSHQNYQEFFRTEKFFDLIGICFQHALGRHKNIKSITSTAAKKWDSHFEILKASRLLISSSDLPGNIATPTTIVLLHFIQKSHFDSLITKFDSVCAVRNMCSSRQPVPLKNPGLLGWFNISFKD